MRTGFGAMPEMEVPGALPSLRPTDQELRMAALSPNDSELLREWIGTEGGQIVITPPQEGDDHYGDTTYFRGYVQDTDGAVASHFEYRAEPAGRVSRATAQALGWLMNQPVAPRGWLNGRVYPPVAGVSERLTENE